MENNINEKSLFFLSDSIKEALENSLVKHIVFFEFYSLHLYPYILFMPVLLVFSKN